MWVLLFLLGVGANVYMTFEIFKTRLYLRHRQTQANRQSLWHLENALHEIAAARRDAPTQLLDENGEPFAWIRSDGTVAEREALKLVEPDG